MKQLSGLDATFLYMETPTTYGHVNGLSIYQRPYPEFDAYRTVYERFGSLVGHIEPFRRRVVDVPFGLDHPYWIDDPHFDLDYHVREIGLAPRGGRPAGGAGRPNHRPADGSAAPAVGGLRHRGPR